MKTLFVYSECDALAKFFVMDGDYSHLNNTILNAVPNDPQDEKNQKQLMDMLYNPETGDSLVEFQDFINKEDLPSAQSDWVVANVGFIP